MHQFFQGLIDVKSEIKNPDEPVAFIVNKAKEVPTKNPKLLGEQNVRSKNHKYPKSITRYQPDSTQGFINKCISKLKRYQTKSSQISRSQGLSLVSQVLFDNTTIKMISEEYFAIIYSDAIRIYRLQKDAYDKVTYRLVERYETHEIIESVDIMHVGNESFDVAVISSNENKIYSLFINGKKKLEISERMCGVLITRQNQILVVFENTIRLGKVDAKGIEFKSVAPLGIRLDEQNFPKASSNQQHTPYEQGDRIPKEQEDRRFHKTRREIDDDTEHHTVLKQQFKKKVLYPLFRRYNQFIYILLKIEKTPVSSEAVWKPTSEVHLCEYSLEEDHLSLTIHKTLDEYKASLCLQDLLIYQKDRLQHFLIVTSEALVLVKKKTEEKDFFSIECSLPSRPGFLLNAKDLLRQSQHDKFLFMEYEQSSSVKNNYDIIGRMMQSFKESSQEGSKITTAINKKKDLSKDSKVFINMLSTEKSRVHESLVLKLKDAVWIGEAVSNPDVSRQLLQCCIFQNKILFFFKYSAHLEILFTKQIPAQKKLQDLLPDIVAITSNEPPQEAESSSLLRTNEYLSDADLKLLQKLNENYKRENRSSTTYNDSARNQLYKLIWGKVKGIFEEDPRNLLEIQSKYLYQTEDIQYIDTEIRELISCQHSVSTDFLRKHFMYMKNITKQKLNKFEKIDPTRPDLQKIDTYQEYFKTYLQSTFLLKKLEDVTESMSDLDFGRWLKQPISEVALKDWRTKPTKFTKFRDRYYSFFIYNYEQILIKLLSNQEVCSTFECFFSNNDNDNEDDPLLSSILPFAQSEKKSAFEHTYQEQQTCFDTLKLKHVEDFVNVIMKFKLPIQEKYMVDNDFLFISRDELMKIQTQLCTDARSIYMFIGVLHDKKFQDFPYLLSRLQAKGFLTQGHYWRIQTYLKVFDKITSCNQFKNDQVNSIISGSLRRFFDKKEVEIFKQVLYFGDQEPERLSKNVKFLLGELAEVWNEMQAGRLNDMYDDNGNPIIDPNSTIMQIIFETHLRDCLSNQIESYEQLQLILIQIVTEISNWNENKQKEMTLLIQTVEECIFNKIKLSDVKTLRALSLLLEKIEIDEENPPYHYRTAIVAISNLSHVFASFDIQDQLSSIGFDPNLVVVQRQNAQQMDSSEARDEDTKAKDELQCPLIKKMIRNYLTGLMKNPIELKGKVYQTNMGLIGLFDLLTNVIVMLQVRNDISKRILLDSFFYEVLADLDILVNKPELLGELQDVYNSEPLQDNNKYVESLKNVINLAKNHDQYLVIVKKGLEILRGETDWSTKTYVETEHLKLTLKQKGIRLEELKNIFQIIPSQFKSIQKNTSKASRRQSFSQSSILADAELWELFFSSVSQFVDKEITDKDNIKLLLQPHRLNYLFGQLQCANIYISKVYIFTVFVLQLRNREAEEHKKKTNTKLARKNTLEGGWINLDTSNLEEQRSQKFQTSVVQSHDAQNKQDKGPEYQILLFSIINMFFQDYAENTESLQSLQEFLKRCLLAVDYYKKYGKMQTSLCRSLKRKQEDSQGQMDLQIYRYFDKYFESPQLVVLVRLIIKNYDEAMKFILRYRETLKLQMDKVLIIIKVYLRKQRGSKTFESSLKSTLLLLGNMVNDNKYGYFKPNITSIDELVKNLKPSTEKVAESDKVQRSSFNKKNEGNDKDSKKKMIDLQNKMLQEFRELYATFKDIITESQKQTANNKENPDKSKEGNEQRKERHIEHDESQMHSVQKQYSRAVEKKNEQSSKNQIEQETDKAIEKSKQLFYQKEQVVDGKAQYFSIRHFIKYVEKNAQQLCRPTQNMWGKKQKTFNMYFFRLFARCVKFDQRMRNCFKFQFFFQEESLEKEENEAEKNRLSKDRKIFESLRELIQGQIDETSYLKLSKAVRYGFNNNQQLELEVLVIYLAKLVTRSAENSNGLKTPVSQAEACHQQVPKKDKRVLAKQALSLLEPKEIKYIKQRLLLVLENTIQNPDAEMDRLFPR